MSLEFERNNEYDIKVTLDLTERLAFVMVNVNFFLQDRTVTPVLALIRQFYDTVRPVYGYGLMGPENYPTSFLNCFSLYCPRRIRKKIEPARELDRPRRSGHYCAQAQIRSTRKQTS